MLKAFALLIAVCVSSSCCAAGDDLLFGVHQEFLQIAPALTYDFKFATSSGGFISTSLGAPGTTVLFAADSSPSAQLLTAELIAGNQPAMSLNEQSYAYPVALPAIPPGAIQWYEIYLPVAGEHRGLYEFDVVVRAHQIPEPSAGLLAAGLLSHAVFIRSRRKELPQLRTS